GIAANVRLGNQKNVKIRPRADLEIRFEKNRFLVHRHLAASPMNAIRWIRMDEVAGRNERRAVGLGQQLARRWRRKDVGKKENAERKAQSGAEHPAHQKDQKSF